MYVVTDNLIVGSEFPSLGLSVLDEMNVPISKIEVQTVHGGKEEVSYKLHLSISFTQINHTL